VDGEVTGDVEGAARGGVGSGHDAYDAKGSGIRDQGSGNRDQGTGSRD
jgi:hypothetical protein